MALQALGIPLQRHAKDSNNHSLIKPTSCFVLIGTVTIGNPMKSGRVKRLSGIPKELGTNEAPKGMKDT